ncbi:MAG: hypothetical protein IH991_22650 [Planctomycetes bacterium]|nr:hypothetical protein [Planctomycetota bacterium]
MTTASGSLDEIERATLQAGFSMKSLLAMQGAISFFAIIVNSLLLCRARFAVALAVVVVSASLLLTASTWFNLQRLAETASAFREVKPSVAVLRLDDGVSLLAPDDRSQLTDLLRDSWRGGISPGHWRNIIVHCAKDDVSNG